MTTNTQILPLYTLDQLSERVCLKLPLFSYSYNAGNMWEGIIERCQKIEDEPRAVDSVIAEAKKLTKEMASNPRIRLYHFILTRVYIILYYRHRDDQIYKAIIFPELKRYMGFYAEEKQLAEIIHAETNKIIELDKLVEEAKKKDVTPVFKFDALNGDERDHLYIDYSEEQLFRNMSGVVNELCGKYGTRLDEAEVWYNAKKVVLTLRDIKRPELMIERAVNALTIGQVFEGYEGAQIILLCVYMMVRESPHHEHFDAFITAMESYALNDNSSMRVLRNVRPIKSWLDEDLPLDDYDYIGNSALKQETFTKEEMERAFAEYEKKIQALEEEKNAKEEEDKNLHETIHRLETQVKSPQEESEDSSEPTLGILYNKVKFELFLRFLEQCDVDVNKANKTDIGDLWHAFTEKSADDCRKYCSRRNYKNNHTKQNIENLNKRLSVLGITSIQL